MKQERKKYQQREAQGFIGTRIGYRSGIDRRLKRVIRIRKAMSIIVDDCFEKWDKEYNE